MLYQVSILMNDVVIFSMLFILCTVFVSSHWVYKNKASNTCTSTVHPLVFSSIDNVMHTCMYFKQLVIPPPQSHRLDLCPVMKPTEVFIYVQCNPCIWNFTVILTKAFYTFINFFSISCRFRFCIEEHCWSMFFFKIDV